MSDAPGPDSGSQVPPDPSGGATADPDVTQFARQFQDFLREMVNRSRQADASLPRLLAADLGVDPKELPVVSRTYPSFELPNIQRALDGIEAEKGDFTVRGVSGIGRLYRDFSELLSDSDYQVGPVDYRSVSIGGGQDLTCLSGALVVLHWDNTPMVLWLRGGDPDDHNQPAILEVASPQREAAEEFFQRLEHLMSERNVFRGKVVSMSSHAFTQGVGPLRFHDPKQVTRNEVILPDGLLEQIERQVAGIAEHREFLRSHDQHLKRGVLLFGPPGTGKTHVINYLLGQLPDFTVVLVSGTAVERISEACSIARKLHPALVIVEDVDLIAEDRGARGGSHPLLLQLLNELDGIGNDVDVAFILTTNQIEILERALAARPGRVDLAVEVPLPDKEGRRRLFRLYADGLGLPGPVIDRMADRCEGVTASFAKEATRRAVLIAGVRGSESVTAADFEQSLDELLSQRDELTRRLLGARMSEQYPTDERKPGNYI